MRFSLLFLLLIMLPTFLFGQIDEQEFWTDISDASLQNSRSARWIIPDKYRTIKLNLPQFARQLQRTPARNNTQNTRLRIIIPMPNGQNQHFEIVETKMMAPALAATFPQIKTYQGSGIEDPTAKIYLDLTPQGFHGMILSPNGAVFIDPYFKNDTEVYVSYYKRDFSRKADHQFACGFDDLPKKNDLIQDNTKQKDPVLNTGSGRMAVIPLKTYRLAVAATGEYTAFHGGSQALGQAAIVTAINRVSGVYEDELGVKFELVANNQNLVYTNSGSDPYSNNNGSTMLNQNINNLNSEIGSGNYDVGHVFSTGGGGVAFLGVICGGSKGGGVTGLNSPTGDPFYIDFVAHEIGHQFGGNHTFNGSTGSCSGGNRNASTGYEPGSGSTIQAYAGICGSQNIQNSSDPYFHLASLNEMKAHITIGSGASCPTTSGSNNEPVANANAESVNGKNIPISTPFELTGSATDADGDNLTYSWEQWDLGGAGDFDANTATGPIFRSFMHDSNPTRIFPKKSDILNNTTTYGEVLPRVGRTLNFQFIARDDNVIGGFDSDQVTLTVVAAAGPFMFTNLNSGGTFSGSETITWQVAGTDGNGVDCANVDIYLSTDGGQTFPTLLADDTPNDGTAIITLPEINVTTARLKIKCADNVFFDISNANFTITPTGSITCAISDITATPSACNAADDTYTASVTVTYTDAPATGNLVINGTNFSITGSPQTETLTNLTADGNAFNITTNFSDNVSCSRTENGIFTAPSPCMPVCNISDVSAATPSACNVADDTYTVDITVTYVDAPATGNLVINGQTFAIISSPQTETLSNLSADGNFVNVTASFSANTVCTYTENNVFTAPAACAPVCAITALAAGAQTACVVGTNTFTQAVTVTYENPPATGNLVINGQSFTIGTSPQTETLTGLVANGSPVNVVANFSVNTTCTFTQNSLFTAPASCAPICSISGLSAGTQTTCDPNTNTYTQEVTVTYTNPPASGNLVVNGQSFAIGTSPQLVVLTNLNSNAAAVNVTANFSADTDCAFTQNNLFTAPGSCAVGCAITSIVASTQSSCDASFNTYFQDLIISYTTPPDRGRLIVNGQRFQITGSPQTVTLSFLPANGSVNNVTAFFNRASDCRLIVDGVFTAPSPCAPVCVITDLTVGTQTACDPNFNDYNQEVIVTYENAPSNGRLVVGGQAFQITGSPQTVNLLYLEADGEPVDVTAYFSRESDCFFTQANLFTAAAPCIPICNITDVTTGVQSACDPNSNTYTQELTVTYENAPSNGRLVVNGQRFFITGSPQTIMLDFLEAGGEFVDLEAYFSRSSSCDFILEDAFAAPSGCEVVCAITELTVGNQGTCNTGSNEYTQEVIVTYENAPSGGRLIVNGQRFDITTSPQTVTLTGLESDGQGIDVSARFSWDFDCSLDSIALFTAPAACQLPCEITAITADTQTACNANTNNYTQEVTIIYANAPTEGFLVVNGQWFNIETSPQTVILENLEADGQTVEVTARFSRNNACTFTQAAVFTAPASCAPVCAITAITAGTQGTCNPTNNRFNQTVVITYVNPPSFGKLVVNGERFSITSSPQTVTLEDLNSDGQAVDVVAYFTREQSCTFTQASVFTAPAACEATCAITALAAGTQGTCNVNDNTYTQEVTVTYENAPTNGKLVVNGQRFAITTSPQTVTLSNLESNAEAVEVTAYFSKKRDCTFTQASLFTAPANCAPLCVVSGLSAGIQGTCNTNNNEYTQEVTVTYENPPSRGHLVVNGQWFNITGSPQTVTLEGLEANGQAVEVTARFSSSDNCMFTQASLFTAPDPCIPICMITNLAIGTQSACNTEDNTFTQEIIVTYENAPNIGRLIVNGQRFQITGSPQTVTLTKLQSNGNMIDVETYFSREPSCKLTSAGLITAPVACLTTVCSDIKSTDTPIAISSTGNPLIRSTIEVNVTGKVTDVNVMSLMGTHTWTSDLVFILTSPSGTSVTLLAHPCDDMDDFNISFDDDAPADEIPCPITDGETYRPEKLLSKFIGEDPLGTWTLKVRDHFDDDGGSLDSWTLEICTNQSNGSCNVANLEVNRDSIYDGDYISNERIRSKGKVRPGAKVMFKSGNTITMESGFTVLAGSDFTAMIDGCNMVGKLTEDMNGILYKTDYITGKSKEALRQPLLENKVTTILKNELTVYPNPFKNNTIIGYKLIKESRVTVRLLNTNGQVLKTIVPYTLQEKGVYQLRLNTPELMGGLYLVQFQTDDSALTKRIIVLE